MKYALALCLLLSTTALARDPNWLRELERQQALYDAREAVRVQRELARRQLDYYDQDDSAKQQFRLCMTSNDQETYERCWREYQVNRPGFVD